MRKEKPGIRGMEETRQFIPVRIAILTVCQNTRTLDNDLYGQTLADRCCGCRTPASARKIVKDDSVPSGM